MLIPMISTTTKSYLLYPPDPTETTKPTYAAGHLNPKDENREVFSSSGVSQERKTIAQLRQETAQKKEKSEDWNTPNPARSLGGLDPNHSNIFTYESNNMTSAEANAKLDIEIEKEIVEWVGIGGILKTSQVSVISEEGICTDGMGKQVFFPPKFRLPLFEWEEKVPRSSSTKSKDSSVKGSLEYVADALSTFGADKLQEKDEPNQEIHRLT